MKKIYVGNLPFTATEDDVKELFGQHGTVHSVALINDRDTIVFLRIADGYAGHTAILALFSADDRGQFTDDTGTFNPATGAASSLHHFALTIPFAEQDSVMAWYDKKGITYRVVEFDWVGWRGIFAKDPEGNTVELVAFDKSMLKESL